MLLLSAEHLLHINIIRPPFHNTDKMCKKPTFSQEKVNLLTAFFSLQKHLFPSLKSDSFWCFTSCLIIASTEQFLAYKVGLISGAFYEILGNKDKNGFLNHVIYSVALLLSITLFKSLRSFLSKTLGVLWRKHLTKSDHDMYFSNLTFYKLISFGKYVCTINLMKKLS